METKVAAIAPAPEAGPSTAPTSSSPPPAKASEPPPVPAGPDQFDMRLVIEQDQASGSYVYKTIDRRTGEVLQQLPRAEVLKMHEGPQYAAGAVVRVQA